LTTNVIYWFVFLVLVMEWAFIVDNNACGIEECWTKCFDGYVWAARI